MKVKYIYDPIHGPISLQGVLLDLIGHPLVQRLWGIRQTGMAHLVFPGSSHTRLEHSLGALWVVREMSECLDLEEGEAERVQVAALLHDIGHTPFSHSLEPSLVEAAGTNHEARTVQLITGDIPEEMVPFGQGIPGYAPGPLRELLARHGMNARDIAALLSLGPERARKPYLSEILHGTIDADRLDYLIRDAHYTGVAHGVIDASRLLATMQVRRAHIAFAEKGRAAVEGFLLGRGLMYSSVYCNKTVRIAEGMLQSAVERSPGFPGTGRALLSFTDGQLLAALEGGGGRSAEMARRLQARQLYKSGFVIQGAVRREIARLHRRPADRRVLEDDFATQLGGRPGDVLLDLPMPLQLPGEDLRIVDEEGNERFLLANDEVLSHLVQRSPIPWQLAVYCLPRLRTTVQRRGPALLDRLL
jgi:HD superfamily phosphohydrolase